MDFLLKQFHFFAIISSTISVIFSHLSTLPFDRQFPKNFNVRFWRQTRRKSHAVDAINKQLSISLYLTSLSRDFFTFHSICVCTLVLATIEKGNFHFCFEDVLSRCEKVRFGFKATKYYEKVLNVMGIEIFSFSLSLASSQTHIKPFLVSHSLASPFFVR